MIQTSQKAEAIFKMTLPLGITVSQQGHTGAAGTHVEIRAKGARTEQEAKEAIIDFIDSLYEKARR